MIMISFVLFIFAQRGRSYFEVLVSILGVDTGYLRTYRVSSQYIKGSATTMPHITLQ